MGGGAKTTNIKGSVHEDEVKLREKCCDLQSPKDLKKTYKPTLFFLDIVR